MRPTWRIIILASVIISLAFILTPNVLALYTQTDCLNCHSETGQAISEVNFSVADVNKTICARCHSYSGHGGASVPVYGPDGSFYGWFQSAASPNTTPSALHSFHLNNYLDPRYSCAQCHRTVDCNVCHSDVSHATHGSTTVSPVNLIVCDGLSKGYKVYTYSKDFTCLDSDCHDVVFNTGAKYGSIELQPSCFDCHAGKDQEHGYNAADHKAVFEPETDCSKCHLDELGPEHEKPSSSTLGKCSACHPLPKDWEWGKSCIEGECHTAATGPGSFHTEKETKHTAPTEARDECVACHHNQADVNVLHQDTIDASGKVGCYISNANGSCHVNNTEVPTTTDCRVCHPAQLEPHGYTTQTHTFDKDVNPIVKATMDESCAKNDCHPINRDSSKYRDLAANHEDYAPSVGKTSCQVCHEPDVATGKTADCFSCHDTTTDFRPKHIYDTGVHLTNNDECAGAGCHTSDLNGAHSIKYDDNGITECNVCHRLSYDISCITVQSYNGMGGCYSCHASTEVDHAYLAHEAEHETSTADFTSCISAGCHVSTNIWEEHEIRNYDCATCHNYPGGDYSGRLISPDAPATAIEGQGMTGCYDCHIQREHGYSAETHTFNNFDDSCMKSCHPSRDLAANHEAYANDQGMSACAVCHDNPDYTPPNMALGKTADCFSCHTDADFRIQHTYNDTVHTATNTTECSGTGCHVLNLNTTHTTNGCGSCHKLAYNISDKVGDNCNSCHSEMDTHAITKTKYYDKHDASPTNLNSCVSAGCHASSKNIWDEHRTLTDPATSSPYSCYVCHNNPDSARKATCDAAINSNNTSCWACHDWRNHAEQDGPHTATAQTGTEGGFDCDVCHRQEVKSEHGRASSSSKAAGCSACHPTAVDSLAPAWGKTCAQGDCHPAYHADMATAHDSPDPNCMGSGCHGSDLSVVHLKAEWDPFGILLLKSCNICHDSQSDYNAWVNSKGEVMRECINCHIYDPALHYNAEQHTANLTGSTYRDYECLGCHLPGLMPEHDTKTSSVTFEQGCEACHPTPRSDFTTWNESCTQTGQDGKPGCHTAASGAGSVHTADTSSHTSTSTNCISSGCHNSNVSIIHQNTTTANGTKSCGVSKLINGQVYGCHVSPDPSKMPQVTRCETCHPEIDLAKHGYNAAQHTAVSIGADTIPGDTPPSPPPPSDGANLALNKSTKASSARYGYSSDNAVDGDTSTYWRPDDSKDEWIYVDLGSSQTINKVVLKWGSYYGRSFKIETSNDASSWSKKYETSSGSGGTDTITFSDTTCRYVRMYCYSGNSSDRLYLTEFEIYGPTTSSPNLALNKSTKASSVRYSYYSSYAVDGNTSTYWRPDDSKDEWIYVDLGSSQTINKVVLKWGSYYGRSFKIETSNDASSWSKKYETSSGSGGTDTITFSDTSCRYVRMYCVSGSSSDNLYLNEFEIYGPTTTTTTPSGTYRGYQCIKCHITELKPEHAKTSSYTPRLGCAVCHPSPRDTLTPSWDKSCIQGGCHTATTGAGSPHTADASKHNSTTISPNCTACHLADVSKIHQNTTAANSSKSCGVYNASGGCHVSDDKVPTVTKCETCHSTAHQNVDALFNPNNPSYHPVKAVGKNDYKLSNGTSYASSLINGWTPTSKMSCSHCHASSSSYQYYLKKPYEKTNWSRPQPSGDLCFDCHKYDVYAGSGGASGFNRDGHVDRDDHTVHCFVCHDVHGSSVYKHLITTRTHSQFIDRDDDNYDEKNCVIPRGSTYYNACDEH